MKQILCLSTQPWSSIPGRTQQLMSRMRDSQILYFSPAMGQPAQKGQKVRPNVTAYTLPKLIFPADERLPFSFHAGQRKLGRFIANQAARNRFRAPLLWATCPDQVHLLDYLDYDSLVYDCDRAWDNLPLEWEGSLALAADIVFAGSPDLADRLAPCSGNIAQLPNGVTYPLFSGEGATLGPDPLPRLQGPLIGFSGTLTPDLDLAPFLYAAQQEPNWNFLLLGQPMDNPLLPKLQRQKNVIFAGPCPLGEVPDWLMRCDVLVELLHQDRPFSDVISTRMFEYLSTGKPVVSMLWPDQVERFPDVVYGAYTREEFTNLCLSALNEAPGFVSQRRKDHGASAAWSERVDQLTRILSTTGLL